MWPDATTVSLVLWLWQPHYCIASGTQDAGTAGRSPCSRWRPISAFPALLQRMEKTMNSEREWAGSTGDAGEKRDSNPME